MDAPFLANDVSEGSYKSDRRFSMHQLHAGLDLENVMVTIDTFCRAKK